MELTNVLSEEIFEKNKFFNECHASTLLKAGNKIICAFFAGSKEGHADVNIYTCVRQNGHWSNPRLMSEGDSVPCWNPVLFEKDGVITLFYKKGKKISTWQTYFTVSHDAGSTWTAAKQLVEGDNSGGRGPVKNKPIILEDGRIVAPASVERRKKWNCFVDISDDSGLTWKKSEFIPFDHSHADGCGIIQPTLWESDDVIYALMRSSESRIMKSFSLDGINWSECKKTVLPNNNSGIDCVKIDNNNIVIIFNPIASDWGNRNVIAYSISDGCGENFSEPVIIEYDSDSNAEFSYPAVICDGKYIYLSYTHYRKTIMFRKFKID